jgi:UDP-GlcNAc:undecaprenyl-phosphate GlcNAc-1-phosphate transferase
VTSRRVAARALVVAVAASSLSFLGLSLLPPATTSRWNRTNFRGRPVSLLGGPALCAGIVAAVSTLPPGRHRRGALIAVLGAGLCGGIDDLVGDAGTRGLRGHLAALANGRLTTGNLKIVGIGASGMIGAAAATGEGLVAAVPAGLVVALAANLTNLLDLRPGRASKVALLAGLAQVMTAGEGAALAGIAAGSTAGLLPVDLGEQEMLGDTGANALGALLGMAAVAGAGRRRIFLQLAVLSALTAASEATSFSAVIDRTPALRFIDRLGRRSDDPDG